MGCDDPKQFGWNRIGEIVERDGVCGFRLMDTADVPDIRSELLARGCRFDTWDVFLAERNAALLASSGIAREPLPSGLSLWTTTDDPESRLIKDTQGMMANAGLVPFSGSMLTREIGRSVTIIIGDRAGVVATAHGYMPHNAFSPYRGYAWGGLVAVTETHRDETMPAIIVSSLRGDRWVVTYNCREVAYGEYIKYSSSSLVEPIGFSICLVD